MPCCRLTWHIFYCVFDNLIVGPRFPSFVQCLGLELLHCMGKLVSGAWLVLSPGHCLHLGLLLLRVKILAQQSQGWVAPDTSKKRPQPRSAELINPSNKLRLGQDNCPMALCLFLSFPTRGGYLGSLPLLLIGQVFLTLLFVLLCDTFIFCQPLVLYLALYKCLCIACYLPPTVRSSCCLCAFPLGWICLQTRTSLAGWNKWATNVPFLN